MTLTLKLTSDSSNPDELLKIINAIHPAAVPSWQREEIKTRYHGEVITRQVALKEVGFIGGGHKMYQSVRRYCPTAHQVFWINGIIECDGERYEGNQISYVSIDINEYDPLSPNRD
jgi:hypothetical protein